MPKINLIKNRNKPVISPTHEIYDPLTREVIGTAVELEDGSLSITINGSFNGIYTTFEGWNAGLGYSIRRLDGALDFDSKKIDFSNDWNFTLGEDDE